MRYEKPLWVIAILAFLAGLWGLFERATSGHLSADYGSYIPWGLWVGAYTYLLGISAGLTIIAAVAYVFHLKPLYTITRLALLAALATFVAGMFSVWLDLGRAESFWFLFAFTNFTSLMGWISWLYVIYLILLVLTLWFLVRADWQRLPAEVAAQDQRRARPLCSVCIPVVLAFAVGEGALFGVAKARPYWGGALLPISFLVTGLLSGSALLTLTVALFGPEKERPTVMTTLGRITLGFLLLEILILLLEYGISLYSAIPAQVASTRLVLFGPFWWVFWIIFVGLGLLVPLILLLAQPYNVVTVATAGGLIAATGIVTKLNLIIPGLAVPELEGLGTAFTGPGLTFSYFPTLSEWSLQLWIVSLGVLLFLVGYRVLPIIGKEVSQ